MGGDAKHGEFSMVEKKSRTNESVAGSSVFPIFNPKEFAAFNERALELASKTSRAYFNCAAKCNQQLLGLMSSRLKKDIDAAQALMDSRSSEDVLRAQAGFVEEILKDYAVGASKILALGAEAVKDALTPPERP